MHIALEQNNKHQVLPIGKNISYMVAVCVCVSVCEGETHFINLYTGNPIETQCLFRKRDLLQKYSKG